MKLTEEQRKKIEETLGADVAKAIYDDDSFKEVVQQRDNTKRRLSELDDELTKLKTARILKDEEVVEFEEFVKSKTKGGAKKATADELEEQRKALLTQFDTEKASLQKDLDFFKNETIRQNRDNAIIQAATVAELNDPIDALRYLRDFVRVEIADGKVVTNVVDEQGKKRFANDGKELSIREAVEQLVKDKPYLKKSYRPEGSGAAGGEGAGADNMTLPQQLAALDLRYEEARKANNIDGMMSVENLRTKVRNAINTKRKS